jgi:putative tryptophan/tyrosine transport system substrate-binding protein
MRFDQLKRREFISALGGVAAGWPLAARGQQTERVRHVGVLAGYDDPDMKAFRQELERLGWSEGRNVHIEYRYAPAGAQVQAHAKELVARQPDVIFAQSRPVVAALQRENRTIPIVFIAVIDPIGAGFIASLPRPGGNITGFMVYEPSVTGKWLAMLKEIAPQLARVALVGNPKTAAYYDYLLHAAEAVAPSLRIELVHGRVENAAADIERAIAAIASVPNGGMVVLPDSTTSINRDLIVALAARHHLPAVYSNRFFVDAGGLMSYGVVFVDEYRKAASYVDRILRGAKPADLPVQTPTKYETVLNLKTATALGLTVPPGLLIAADEVIE